MDGNFYFPAIFLYFPLFYFYIFNKILSFKWKTRNITLLLEAMVLVFLILGMFASNWLMDFHIKIIEALNQKKKQGNTIIKTE